MRKFALVTIVTIVTTLGFAQESPGMYVDQQGQLVKMEHARRPEGATKGVAKSVFVPGAMPSGVWIFPGAQAPLRVSARPRFVYRLRPEQTVNYQDLVLVRMDPKSDSREIRVANVSAWTGNARAGFDQKKLVAIDVKRKGETLEISPAADLDAGEYFVTAGFSPVGFDFEVTK